MIIQSLVLLQPKTYITSVKPRILILCDKGPRTSFGRIAESFRRALQDQYEPILLWHITYRIEFSCLTRISNF